ncbi:hypothetical protein FPSE_06593 [Fusarium pseudograminearum CS3096]|uniref:Uncharacterized protein n=1 Tax=Fusarium pseudograminearum (strain CS3096) TaxID=1028729 RepID=K3VGF3_FUSPC|nr:hypothetical protein FPSE_06593 [Fusarium pseudograminearum CS3096]EKJ73169.1 hypothetical protein FPSE_06593 [Fusarium pseudograminearum CS3096]KAF0640677.1 hypothetical protein FPSE5266_06593 [Fusarium pseudograminearum]
MACTAPFLLSGDAHINNELTAEGSENGHSELRKPSTRKVARKRKATDCQSNAKKQKSIDWEFGMFDDMFYKGDGSTSDDIPNKGKSGPGTAKKLIKKPRTTVTILIH